MNRITCSAVNVVVALSEDGLEELVEHVVSERVDS